MKIAELFKQPVMLYVSSDARHFTNGHNSQPVRVVDSDVNGLLVEDAHPNSSPDLVYYPFHAILAIVPAAVEAEDPDHVYVQPGARMPKDPNRS